jgi:hypothetical protein
MAQTSSSGALYVANLLLELQKDGAVEDALAPYCGRRVEEAAGQIVHELVMKTFARRAAERRMTGDFIVYERRTNGSNYYLTLGSHGEYPEIYARVEAYRKIDREQDCHRSL